VFTHAYVYNALTVTADAVNLISALPEYGGETSACGATLF